MRSHSTKTTTSFFLLTLGFLTLNIGCNNDQLILDPPQDSESEVLPVKKKNKKGKINICKYDEDSKDYVVININLNAWPSHEAKGAVRLDDQDGDGYVPTNECGYGEMGDNDDLDDSIHPYSEYEILKTVYLLNPAESSSWGWNLEDTSMESWNDVTLTNGSVTKLQFRGSGIDTIPPVFGKLKNLQHLVLTSPNLILPPEFGDLQNLKIFNAYESFIRILPPEFGNLKNLEVLEVGYLASIEFPLPDEFWDLPNLKSLFLSGRNTRFPSGVGNLTNLRYLGIDNVKALPPEIGDLKNLNTLVISLGSLECFPNEIGKLENLTSLKIYKNLLFTTFPTEIGNLKNLKELVCQDSGLTTIPPEVGNLENLEILNLFSNGISSVPANLGKLSKLTYLELRGNPLTEVPIEVCNLANNGTVLELGQDVECVE